MNALPMDNVFYFNKNTNIYSGKIAGPYPTAARDCAATNGW